MVVVEQQAWARSGAVEGRVDMPGSISPAWALARTRLQLALVEREQRVLREIPVATRHLPPGQSQSQQTVAWGEKFPHPAHQPWRWEELGAGYQQMVIITGQGSPALMELLQVQHHLLYLGQEPHQTSAVVGWRSQMAIRRETLPWQIQGQAGVVLARTRPGLSHVRAGQAEVV